MGNDRQSLKLANFVLNLNINCVFIFAGSIDEYGGLEYPDEMTDLSNLAHSPYAFWKIKTGKELHRLFLNHPRISFSHLRICYLFGRGQRRETLLPVLLNRDVYEYKIIHSEFLRDLMWVEDFSYNLVNLLKLNDIPSIINFGRGESIYWRNFISKAWVIAGKKPKKLMFRESSNSTESLFRPHMNIELIKGLLGEQYYVSSLDDALMLIVSAIE